MKVSCPACEAKYNIADDKVQGKKVKVRCKTCGSQILVNGTVPQTSSPNEQPHINAVPDKISVPSPSAAPANEDTWSVNFSETDERSLTAAEIADLAAQGLLGDEVYVWKDGMDDWVLITKVPELASAIAAAKKRAPTAAKSAVATVTKTSGAGRSAAPPPAQESGTGKGAAKKAGESSGSAASTSQPPAATNAGPIVAAPGSALAKKLASAKSAAAQKAMAAASHDDTADGHPSHKATASDTAPHKSEPAASSSPKASNEPKAATKLTTKRQVGAHDLFAAVDKAGSEIEVDTSEVHEHEPVAKTGARNENSVLFSLDALKSGLGSGGASSSSAKGGGGPRKKAPAAPGKRLEDLMTVDMPAPAFGAPGAVSGGGLLLSGSGNDALLAAPPPPPKPEPKRDFSAQASGGFAYAAPPQKKRIGLIIGLAAGMLALGAGGAVLALKSGSADTKAGHGSGTDTDASIVAAPFASAAPKPSASVEVAKSDVD